MTTISTPSREEKKNLKFCQRVRRIMFTTVYFFFRVFNNITSYQNRSVGKTFKTFFFPLRIPQSVFKHFQINVQTVQVSFIQFRK